MELTAKHFDELTAAELFDIYKLRVSVFVVEQQCPYQEVDDADRYSYHLCLRDGPDLIACLRVVQPGVLSDTAAIGRVVSVRRRQGFASLLLREGLRTAREKYGAEAVTLEAQVYARSLYEKAGFVSVSEEFLEDGIPHIRMRYTFPPENGGRTK